MTKARFWINYWLPALGWNAAMAVFSTASFGANNTGLFFRFLLEDVLRLHLSPPEFELTHFLVRKCAHFFGYALLSLLWFRLLRKRSASGLSWRWQWFALALGICLVTSSADEIHQAFTPGRTGAWEDVALDMMGAAWMQSVVAVTSLEWRRGRASR